MAVVISATWIAKPGEEETIIECLRNLAAGTRTEPGNLLYHVYQNPEEPQIFRLFEVYIDQDAVTAHGETEHFKTWVTERAAPSLVERRREYFTGFDF